MTHQKPKENQTVEFLCDNDEETAQGIYCEGGVFSSYDGYHEPKLWRPIIMCPNCHFSICNQDK